MGSWREPPGGLCGLHGQFVLPLTDIRSIEKKKNGLIPSAIHISTDTAVVRSPLWRAACGRRVCH